MTPESRSASRARGRRFPPTLAAAAHGHAPPRSARAIRGSSTMFRRTRELRDPVTVHLDGSPVTAERGEPLAVALLADDKTILARSPKLHRPRSAELPPRRLRRLPRARRRRAQRDDVPAPRARRRADRIRRTSSARARPISCASPTGSSRRASTTTTSWPACPRSGPSCRASRARSRGSAGCPRRSMPSAPRARARGRRRRDRRRDLGPRRRVAPREDGRARRARRRRPHARRLPRRGLRVRGQLASLIARRRSEASDRVFPRDGGGRLSR